MQFIAGGPDIPEELLQAHEEGHVVFFCGAGISYPAGLPGFKGLVDEVYNTLGTEHEPIEHSSYANQEYDQALMLLENRLVDGPFKVRSAVAKALEPNLRRKGATETHRALIELASRPDGTLRLVTTNFDRIFEHVIKKNKLGTNCYTAPMLPVPKNIQWNGLVYLHGSLSRRNDVDENELRRLVITSGDFGRAYLTERWAARFASELFRNYIVCFVGYSIEDRVLRYMMDALAADRTQGEKVHTAYAFGKCRPGDEAKIREEWEAKGVTPILYQVTTNSSPASPGEDHSSLHKSLWKWSESYRDGVLGKERIVVDYAMVRPSRSTVQDNFVGRMIWAMSDPSGTPAKRFAELNPVPHFEWLKVFSENRFENSDVKRFGVAESTTLDETFLFSFLDRPCDYRHSPRMSLVSKVVVACDWDQVMWQLAHWLVRHLNEPELIIWLAKHGGRLHHGLRWLIESKLDEITQFELDQNESKLAEIKLQSPNAIPSPLMRTLWRILLAGQVKSKYSDSLDIIQWKEKFKRDGLTSTLRLQLRKLLEPRVVLDDPLPRIPEVSLGEPTHISELVDWKLELASKHVRTALSDLNPGHWEEALRAMIDDFQQLLYDATELMCELDGTGYTCEMSHWYLPSISKHDQNRWASEWVVLIELLRDAWLATRKIDMPRAIRIALNWYDLKYSIFRRLALFAASQDNCFQSDIWVEWLITDDSHLLWSTEFQRETLSLLRLQGRHLTPASQTRLEDAILCGPIRQLYSDELEPGDWERIHEHAVLFRLSKLNQPGTNLSKTAIDRLATLSQKYPQLRSVQNERDEFSSWKSGTGDPDFEANKVIVTAPLEHGELVAWLRTPNPHMSHFSSDNWSEWCGKEFEKCLAALEQLAMEDEWPTGRWRDALTKWGIGEEAKSTWSSVLSVLRRIPERKLDEGELGPDVAWWVERVSESTSDHSQYILELCEKLLAVPFTPSTGISQNGVPIDSPMTEAQNHPIGRTVNSLLNIWSQDTLKDNDQLREDLKPLFTRLCNTKIERFRHGRVQLATCLIELFRVDRPWTEQYLLPLFDWAKSPREARAVWQGFLWSPRLYSPLFTAFKTQFFETANHYDKLDEYGGSFVACLTYAAIEPIDGFSKDNFRKAFIVLPPKGLQQAAESLVQILKGAGDKRETYWKKRIKEFWQSYWPKTKNLVSAELAEPLARLCIAAGGEFPDAMQTIGGWLKPLPNADQVVLSLHSSGLCAKHPKTALTLLDKVLGNQPWAPSELGDCLSSIASASPVLTKDLHYKRLREFLTQRGV